MKAKDLMQILQEFRDSKALKDKNLVKCNLKKAGFDQGRLSGIDFSEAKLVRSKFISSQIEKSQFVKASLSRSDFSQVKGVECDFSKADVAIAKFEKSKFENSAFDAIAAEFVEMPEAEFVKTSFAGAVIKVSKLGKATFRECVFTKADMSDATCEEAVFENCDMRESTMLDVKGNKVVFKKVDFSQADLSYSDFVGAKFIECDFSESCLKYVDVTDAVFENCKFKGANFKGAIALGKDIEAQIIEQGGRVSKKVVAKFIKSVFASIGKAFCWVFVSIWRLVSGFCFGITGFIAKLFGISASQKEKAWVYLLSYVIIASFVVSLTLFFLASAFAIYSFAKKGGCPLMQIAGTSAGPAPMSLQPAGGMPQGGEQQPGNHQEAPEPVKGPPQTVMEILRGFEGFIGFQEPPAVLENMVDMEGCYLQDKALIAIGQKEDESLDQVDQAQTPEVQGEQVPADQAQADEEPAQEGDEKKN